MCFACGRKGRIIGLHIGRLVTKKDRMSDKLNAKPLMCTKNSGGVLTLKEGRLDPDALCPVALTLEARRLQAAAVNVPVLN